MINPITLNRLSDIRVIHKVSMAPTTASGTASRITNGSIKLSNWAANTMYTSTTASPNISTRLDWPSRNSRAWPRNAVENVGGNNSLAICATRVNAWSRVVPGDRPAVRVADRIRL